jgi:DNA polymerase-3 subunit delta
MKKLSSEALLKNLKKASQAVSAKGVLTAMADNGIHNPLVLITEESVRAKRTISWIENNFLADSQLEVKNYFGSELRTKNSVDTILHSLGTASLFSPTQIIVIHEVDKLRVAAADPLFTKFSKMTPASLLVLVSDKYNPKSPVFSRLPKEFTLTEFTALSDERLRKWIAKEAKALGIAGVEARAAQKLAQALGGDLSLLSGELAKLSLLCEPGENLGTALVEQYVQFSPEVGSFDLFAAIANRKSLKAEILARKLVTQGLHPLQLSAFLSRCVRTLLAQQSGGIPISKELSNAWFRRSIGRHSRSFSIPELRAALKELAILDYSLKGDGFSDELSISLAIRKLSLRTSLRDDHSLRDSVV